MSELTYDSVAKKRGRPNTNVFDVKRKKLGKPPHENFSLDHYRVTLLLKHKLWEIKFGRSKEERGKLPILQSYRFKRWGNERWKLYRDIEMAMIVMGKKCPDKYENRPGQLDRFLPFQDEAFLLERYVDNITRQSNPVRKGPKLSAEKLFRTALSAEVARKLVQPKGGNHRTCPSPRQIAQVWYVIFGEEESHENIRKRLPLVGKICTRFPLDKPTTKLPHAFPKLGKAIAKRYGLK